MSMTDPLSDMLTRIRNALIAKKRTVAMPASKMKERIAEILCEEGFLSSVSRTDQGGKESLVLDLRYADDNRPVIQSLRRLSRPGQRRYVRHDTIPKIRSGLGVAILSTSRGVMTDSRAREVGVGGELICEVW